MIHDKKYTHFAEKWQKYQIIAELENSSLIQSQSYNSEVIQKKKQKSEVFSMHLAWEPHTFKNQIATRIINTF